MLLAKDFRKIALEGLQGNWIVAVLTGIVAGLLGAYTQAPVRVSFSSSGLQNVLEESEQFRNFVESDWFQPLLSFFFSFVLIFLVYAIICLLIGGMITLGYCQFYLNLLENRPVHVMDLFAHKNRWGKGLLLSILTSFMVSLWTLLLIVPGIIASYSYAMAPYILAEHTEMAPLEAIQESKRVMNGNKWRLFCLHFSFIGWKILAVFTGGIGFLVLNPYMEAANAAFYLEITKKTYSKPKETVWDDWNWNMNE